MTQAQKIAAALVAGYMIYTIARGNLPTWLFILGMREDTLRSGPAIGET